MEKQSSQKLFTLVGFAIKSGAVRYGQDNITPKTSLVIYSSDLSEGSKEKIIGICKKWSIESKMLNSEIFTNIFKEGIKLANFKTCELTDSIRKLMEEF